MSTSRRTPLDGAEDVLRAMAARDELYPSDQILLAVKRDGLRHCIIKWAWQARDLGLWDQPAECPEADSDGVPTHEQHRAILAILRERGPLKVAAIAAALGVDPSQLYRGPGALPLLAQMGLAEKCSEGYRLTAKGERVAEEPCHG